jgi:uncharacterized protein (DUF1499 family)
VVALLAVGWFVFAALATKFGLIDWTIGFGLMTVRWGVFVILGALGFCLIGLLLALALPPRRGWALALAAAIVPASMLAYGQHMRDAAQAIPPLHDVTTAPDDPPSFSQAVITARERSGAANDLDFQSGDIPAGRFGAFGGRPMADVHREAYADLKPLYADLAPADLYEIALHAATRQSGWTIVSQDPEAGRIEAEVRSFWFGFTDDVVVRIRPLSDASGSIVDMRSVSRVGLSDLGANAERIRGYLEELDAQIADSATGA